MAPSARNGRPPSSRGACLPIPSHHCVRFFIRLPPSPPSPSQSHALNCEGPHGQAGVSRLLWTLTLGSGHDGWRGLHLEQHRIHPLDSPSPKCVSPSADNHHHHSVVHHHHCHHQDESGGTADTPMLVPPAPEGSSKPVVRHTAAGEDFTLMATEAGNLYSWGSGTFGQVGTEASLWHSFHAPPP